MAVTKGFLLEKVGGVHINHELEGVKPHGNRKYPDGAPRPKRGKRALNEKILDIEAQFMPSKKKGASNMLRDPEGYPMHLNRRQGGAAYWRCASHYGDGCKATAVTVGSKLHKVKGIHSNHVEKVHASLGRTRDALTNKWDKTSGVKDKMEMEKRERTINEESKDELK